ncbi:MAG: Ig-like domain-containing protein, partial [Actinomycetota bacterium]|nr:Ig-like domain-containing protein [Actinomycetota bacterium]
ASHTWTVDTIAPTVDGVSPADGSTDAAETANVEATFAEEMDAATLTTDTFTLARQDGGSPVTATVTYNAAARTASLDPDAALASGTIYTATVKGGATGTTDLAGNPLAADHAWSFAVADLTPPETTIDDQPADSTNSAEATFAFSSEAGATFACQLDGEAWASCTSPTTVTGLVDGSHTFQVRATDAADNTDPTPASHTWTVDTTAPETTIDDVPADPTDQTDATLTFSSSDPGASFACRLDGGDFAACASPKEYTGLAEGSHTFEVRATDVAGNVDQTPAAYTWTITAPADTTAPTVTDVAPPDGATGVAVADDVTATFAEAMDPATLTPQTFTLRPQGGQAIAAQVRLNAAGTTATLGPDAELVAGTTYTATVEGGSNGATDAAGNPLASDHAWSFTTAAPTDTTAPETTIDEAPDNPSGSPEATFAFSADDPGATFECQLDAGVYEPCASPTSYSNLTDGEHSFAVRASDGAGNTDATPASHTWTIDATGPETTIDSGPSDLTSSTSATFSFSASEAIATFACSLDGAAFELCLSPAEYTGLAEGQHDFQVRSTDLLGNTDPTPATRTWTVDTTPPTVGTGSPPHGAIEVLIDTNVEATFGEPMDPASLTTGTFTLAPPGGLAVAAQVSHDAATQSATLDPDTDLEFGTIYTATITTGAKDAAGNSLAADYAWSFTTAAPPDTTAPETVIDTGPSGTTNMTTATFAFSSEAGATFECGLDGADFVACTSPTGYDALADGEHAFAVRAVDTAGNADASPATRTWTVDATAPTVTNVSPADGATDVAAGAAIEFTFSETMDPASLTAGTFTLAPQGGRA